jgi:predicted TPR repeat methyltransferase
MSDETFYERAYALAESDTKDFYAQWAATYDHELVDDNGYVQPRRCGDAMRRFVPDRSARVLDMGCGTGLAGSELRRLGYESIDGYDYSPEMLAQAAETGAYDALFEIDLNNHPLPIEPASYDAICAVGVLSFGHVRSEIVDEMLRVLPAGGVFVICINEQWWDEGSLAAKIDQVEASGAASIGLREEGPHVPSHGVLGWVIVGQKA